MAAPGGIAPAVQGGGAPAAPQLPYGADPGTFTGWLLHDTATLSESEVVQSIVGALEKHTSLPQVAAEGYREALQGLIEEALSGDDLNCFAEVSASASGTEIGIVSSLGRYSAGFGVASTHNGCVFGLRGEMVHAVHLPPLVQVPSAADGGISSLFAPRDCVAPTVAQITIHYSSPISGRLMAPPAGAPPARFPPLLFVPKAWAPYFLKGQSPAAAYLTAAGLVASLSSDVSRGLVGPWLEWFAAACIRLGPMGPDRGRSVFHTPWQGTIAEPRLLSWAATRCAPHRLPMPIQPGPPAGAPTGTTAPTAMSTSNEATFTPLETLQLLAACSLSAADFSEEPPQVYTAMLQEGRTKAAIERILARALTPDMDSEHPINVFVSQDLVNDVKVLRYGYSGDLSYASCHRGISPFAVAAVTAEQAASRRRKEDRLSRVTSPTAQDLEKAETSPSQIPTDYNGLVALLHSYLTLLRVLCGTDCAHYIGVRGLRSVLVRNRPMWESISHINIAFTLWEIFVDARRFFSSSLGPDGELPTSMLAMAQGFLQTGTVKSQETAPMNLLLGQTRPAPAGGLGGPSMDEMFPAGRRAPGNSTVPRINTAYHPKIKGAMQGVLAAFPDAQAVTIMAAHDPPLRYDQTKSPRGGCIEFHLMGKCRKATCSYSHVASAAPMSDTKAIAAAALLSSAITCYTTKRNSGAIGA
jgi:hypothetical protein